ncbi:MAG: hypothetical protein U5L45_24040 [Saprospiraceae bacterium]|nr:hypothetical protein [Saprospiraceae bacterium]
MKNIISITFALLILLQSFSKVWIVFSFKINQDYIAKVLCINRDKPEKHCDGQCVLMQRVKAEEEQEKKQLPQKLKEQKEVIYCFELQKWSLDGNCRAVKTTQKRLFSYQPPFTSTFVKGIFHPPDFITVQTT